MGATFAAGRGWGFGAGGFDAFGCGSCFFAGFGAGGFNLGFDGFEGLVGFFDGFGGDFFTAFAAGLAFEGVLAAFGVAFACFFAMLHFSTPVRS